MDLIKPKDIEVEDIDGNIINVRISRLPATIGREILVQYLPSAMPKVGDYKVNEDMMLKLMAHVAVVNKDGDAISLSNKTLVDNHIPDWQTLAKIEVEMLRYNTDFFDNGKISNFFEVIKTKAQALISKMLTDSLAQSSKENKQP